jgi:hypothetical protein
MAVGRVDWPALDSWDDIQSIAILVAYVGIIPTRDVPPSVAGQSSWWISGASGTL